MYWQRGSASLPGWCPLVHIRKRKKGDTHSYLELGYFFFSELESLSSIFGDLKLKRDTSFLALLFRRKKMNHLIGLTQQ